VKSITVNNDIGGGISHTKLRDEKMNTKKKPIRKVKREKKINKRKS